MYVAIAQATEAEAAEHEAAARAATEQREAAASAAARAQAEAVRASTVLQHTAVVQSSSRLRWRNAASALCAYRVMGEVVYIEPDRGHASGQSMTCVRPYSTLCAPTIRHAIYLRIHSTFSMLHTCIYTAHLACCMAVLPRSHMYTGYTCRCHSHAIQSPEP